MWKTTRLHSTQKSSEQPQTRNIDIIKKDPTPRENHHPTPQGRGVGSVVLALVRGSVWPGSAVPFGSCGPMLSTYLCRSHLS